MCALFVSSSVQKNPFLHVEERANLWIWGLTTWMSGVPDTANKKKNTQLNLKSSSRDLPGGPEAKTLHSQRRELGFDPWSGN